jgi:hypothetical protein
MKEDKKQSCSVCGKEQAKTECDNCGTVLCGECCKLEIWGTGAEDLSARYFCPACKDNPDVNPWGAYINVSDGAEKQEHVIRKVEGKNIRAAGSKRLPGQKKRQAGYGRYTNTHLPSGNGMHASAHK